MHKRLTLARTLLKPEGVIFISIDDNEQAQLKLLCDRVFGEANFVANVIWRSADSSNNDAKQFSVDHNHTLVYSRVNGWQPKRLGRSEDNNTHYKNPDNDPNGPWFSGNVSSPSPRKNLQYIITAPNGNKIEWPSNGWRWSKERVDEMIDRGEIIFSKDNSRIIKKTYLKDQKGLAPSSIWWNLEETGHNRNAKYELIKIFPDKNTSELFSTPKPTKLINRIIQLASSPDALVLDFFAGSGTTLHAVMALNEEDGGNRQCILVTNNENNIAEEVCYERNRRVIEGYTNSKGVAVPGLTANHLHYYQTAYVGRERTLANKRALMLMATELIQIKEGCFTSVNKEWREEEGGESIRLFTSDNTEMPDHDRYVVVIYDENAIDTAVALIQNLPTTVTRVNVYVFAPGFYPYTDDFADVADRIELTALPEAIYQAYGRLLPPAGIPADVVEATETTSAVPESPTLLLSRPQ